MLQLNKKSNSNALLIVAVILMTVALYSRDLFGIIIAKNFFVALAILPALFMSYQSLVYFFFFLFPLTSGLPGNIIFPLLIIVLLLKKRGAVPQNSLYCFAVLAFMELVHYPFYDFGIVVGGATVGYLCNLFLLIYLVSLKNDAVDTKQCLLCFCFGLAVFLVAIYYITRINGDIEMLLEESGRLGDTKTIAETEEGVMMLNANPNGLGFFSIVGVATTLVLYSLKRVKIWVMLLFSTIFIYVGAMGLSRTFLISVALLVALFLLLSGRTMRRKSMSRTLFLFAFLAVLFYISWSNPLLYNAYTGRLERTSEDDMGGRIRLFFIYNQFLLENPKYLLFGAGAVYYHRVIDVIELAAHNGLQQIVVSYGLIGLLFFIYITIRAIKKCYLKKNPITLIPFIIAFFYVQSGQLLNPSTNLYLFIIAFFVMKLSKDESTKVNSTVVFQ